MGPASLTLFRLCDADGSLSGMTFASSEAPLQKAILEEYRSDYGVYGLILGVPGTYARRFAALKS